MGLPGDIRRMARGSDLWRESCPDWAEAGSFLLLNPRMDPTRREQVLAAEFPDLKDHVWLATSGTGGTLKIVALSRGALECSATAVNHHFGASRDDMWLNALPLFHVGGLGIMARSHLSRARCEMFADAWDPQRFVIAARSCGATLSALVPTQVHDVVRAGLRAPGSLRAVVVGGGALSGKLFQSAAELGWPLLPSYGLTEASSQVATMNSGGEFSAWLPLLSHVEARVDADGVMEVRGDSLLTGWMIFDERGIGRWEAPKKDGWYRTGDRAELRGRDVRILGRIDDLVKIRGELVDVAAVGRALQERVASGCVFVCAEADERNGSVLCVQAENDVALSEAKAALDVFPPFARPEIYRVAPVERTALGKPLRSL